MTTTSKEKATEEGEVEPSQLVVSEEREIGSVSWRTYLKWAKAAGMWAALPGGC